MMEFFHMIQQMCLTLHSQMNSTQNEEINNIYRYHNVDFPGGSDNKESACNVGDPGSIPGSEKSPGEGNNYPLQYSCLENSRDRGNWLATDHGVAESRTRLSD